jgi:pyridoxamine 5'-phosphate oxidase
LGAWASPQSQPVPSRDFLDERYALESDRFAGVDEVPRPPHWSGFVVRPHRIEFWQGRPGRMHDRIRFERVDEDNWAVERLAP